MEMRMEVMEMERPLNTYGDERLRWKMEVMALPFCMEGVSHWDFSKIAGQVR